jgi:hypothetical protein
VPSFNQEKQELGRRSSFGCERQGSDSKGRPIDMMILKRS